MKLTIPSINAAPFKKRMEDIAKRSAKLGLGEVKYTFIRDVYREMLGDDNVVYGQNYHEYEITGPNIDQPLSLGGYEFVGKIDHTHSEYMWKAYGDEKLPPHVQQHVEHDNSSYCEHCNTKRNRKNTFVVRNIETQNVVWVGSTCLKDFIGLDSPEQLVKYYQSLGTIGDFEDEERMGGGYNIFDVAMDLSKFLPRAYNIAKDYGFVTNKMADHITRSTADDTFCAYWRTDKRKWNPITAEDCEFADAAVEWWMAKDADTDFVRNIQIICKDMWCKAKEQGLAAYIIGGYMAYLDDVKKAERPESQYFGEEGQKVNGLKLEMTVDRVWEYTDYYGYEETISFCYLMYTDDGIAFKMNSGKVLELGERIMVTSGSIKEHKLYEGANEKQNILARPRFKVLTPDEA
ncbi:hypothetical protein VPHK356_0076 [Vibrio phage K356]